MADPAPRPEHLDEPHRWGLDAQQVAPRRGLDAAGLRAELMARWDELENSYGAVVNRAGMPHRDVRRLRVEIEWAEHRLAVLAEGVRAGWLPPEYDGATEEQVACRRAVIAPVRVDELGATATGSFADVARATSGDPCGSDHQQAAEIQAGPNGPAQAHPRRAQSGLRRCSAGAR